MATSRVNRLLFNSNISVSHSGGNLSSDSGLILAKELMDKFKFSQILRKNIQIQDDRLYYIHENECILEQIVLQLIAGYGSEENYQIVVDTFDKVPLIPYSTQNDKNSFERQFNVYKADVEQQNEKLDWLAKTPKGVQRQTSVNYNWEYFKHHVKENLESDHGKAIYAQRKIDVETIFDRLKGGIGMRRTHVRGNQAVHTDIGMMLMSMNLTKLALEARRKVEAFQHKSVKNKNRDETITFMIISSRFLFLELVISQQLFHFLGIFPLGAYF